MPYNLYSDKTNNIWIYVKLGSCTQLSRNYVFSYLSVNKLSIDLQKSTWFLGKGKIICLKKIYRNDNGFRDIWNDTLLKALMKLQITLTLYRYWSSLNRFNFVLIYSLSFSTPFTLQWNITTVGWQTTFLGYSLLSRGRLLINPDFTIINCGL